MSAQLSEAGAAAPVTYADVEAAARRLEGVAHRTPVVTSRTFDAAAGCTAFFKCENLQRMGAFKFRGAYNALATLPPAQRGNGVVAFSSGNHAQAVALAGQLLGIATTIVMPADAPQVKVQATRGYGARVVLYDRERGESREEVAARIARESGAAVVPPFDHAAVIAGSAIAAHHLSPGVKVIGVEPAAGDDATRSFRSRKVVSIDIPRTIADGARTQSLGTLTFPLVMRHVQDFVTVSDAQLVEAMRFLWERMKLVVEPTGALGAAGVLTRAIDVRDRRVGILISGGNVDLKVAAQLFA